MDRRIERTRRAIINTFLELRSKKAIEKISIKELCEGAGINKSTFYAHFQDIYDLSEQLETQVAADILSDIGHPEELFAHPEEFTRRLYYAFLAQEHLIHILFSGSREGLLVERIEQSLKEMIRLLSPGLLDDPAADTLFTLEIYGEYYAFQKCRGLGDDAVIAVLCEHSRRTMELLQAGHSPQDMPKEDT